MKKEHDSENEIIRGNVTYKTIRGARRMYLQWYEDGKKISKYVRKADEDKVLGLIALRKRQEAKKGLYDYDGMRSESGMVSELLLLQQYETRVVAGDELRRMCSATWEFGRRDCCSELSKYLRSDADGKVCIVYGLRRTGKTFMIRQAIGDLPLEKSVYIKIQSSDEMSMLNRDLMKLSSEGISYVFIDEITLMSDFIDSASLLSDIYASSGMKIVLSGTDSLGFSLSLDDELYDRAVMIHTTFIPFREYSRLLGIDDVDEYIRYGGTFRVGELSFDDEDLIDEKASFADDETVRRYIDTSIARNIQHSLAGYKAAGHFRHLADLYEAGELTNAINRLIEDMNHRFLVSVLTRDFISHDLGSAGQIERKRAAAKGKEGILDRIDTKEILDKLMNILDIRNKEELSVDISADHVNEIRQYLFMLDLIVNVPSETIDSAGKIERIVFSQPGLRYCQAQALVYSLMGSDDFLKYPAAERKEVIDLLLEEVRGRMLEEMILLETVKVLPRGKRAFRLEFEAGEFDMVIFDENELNCEIYKIKHSSKADKKQCRHLLDKDKCSKAEFRYGNISGKYVLYNGEDKNAFGVGYLNITEYLKHLGREKVF
ncbi:MAG: AAA family ATPase [Lachnospiraceae bacterium]|nr:AAA family ATPase [Lachnospiraceae bacterium]